MRILFLNQYFPPDPAPTGVLLRDLAGILEAAGHEVEFVSAQDEYRSGQRRRGRIIRELKALARMLVDGLSRRRADLIVSASSPPCLLFVATLVARRHRAQSIHWIMDLYPEIAVAMGELKAGFAVSLIERLMGWGYRSCRAVVALDSDMASRLKRYGITAQVIRPWVVEDGERKTEVGGRRSEDGERKSEDGERKSEDGERKSEDGESDFRPTSDIRHPTSDIHPTSDFRWIYSGNLGRAHEWETILQVQALLEKNEDIRQESDGTSQPRPSFELVFQGGGPSWPAAQARAKALGLKRCEWKPYVAESELRDSLLDCQCLVASQLPAAQGLLWPSKLSLLLSLPRPILWIGPVDGAVGSQLRALPHAGIFAPGQVAEIAQWLRLLQVSGSKSEVVPLDASEHRRQSLQSWVNLICVGVAPGVSDSVSETTAAIGACGRLDISTDKRRTSLSRSSGSVPPATA